MYYGLGFLVLLVVVYAVWASFFNSAPTCYDNKQDGTELGVDCGGSCALLCQDTAKQPILSGKGVFQTGTNTYTAVAFIKNNNIGSGAKNVPYSFQLFDANNNLVKEYDGVTDLPPLQNIPLIVTNIPVGNRTVTSVQFAFSQLPVWYKVPQNSLPTLYVSQQNLSSDASNLSATLTNNQLTDAKNVTVAAVLFDADGVARAASKSLVPLVPARGSQQVVFTWPQGVPNIVRADITVLPSF